MGYSRILLLALMLVAIIGSAFSQAPGASPKASPPSSTEAPVASPKASPPSSTEAPGGSPFAGAFPPSISDSPAGSPTESTNAASFNGVSVALALLAATLLL